MKKGESIFDKLIGILSKSSPCKNKFALAALFYPLKNNSPLLQCYFYIVTRNLRKGGWMLLWVGNI